MDATTGGKPARKLTIHVTDRNAETRKITAGIDRVTVPGLAPGAYSIRVSAPGYVTVDLPRVTLDRPGKHHEIEVALERRGGWGDGTLVVTVPHPEREAADGAPPLLWLMIRDEAGEPIESDPGPHRRTEQGFVVRRKVAAGRYRIHGWTKDDRWATRTVEVKTDWNQTAPVELTLFPAGWIRLTVERAEHPRRKVVIEDASGLRQGISLWDALPARAGKFGPLAPGKLTLRLLDGGVEVASTSVIVVADREVPVTLR